MRASVQNRLAKIRKSRGVSVASLAREVNVSRQTIYAIEAGLYVPNTKVALQLARCLEATVDELFSLGHVAHAEQESFVSEVLTRDRCRHGQPVRICQVSERWISVPVSAAPYSLPDANGIIQQPALNNGRAHVIAFAKEEINKNDVVLAGCDPATSLLAQMMER